MGYKKCVEATKPKRKVVISTIKVKKELIAKHESGTRVAVLAAMFGMPKSTVCTIIKNKEAIKAANVAKGVTTLTPRRSHVIEEMEKLLLVWINEKQLAGDIVSERIICEKAKQLHSDIKKRTPGTSAESEEFKGSRGWFNKFRKRTGIYSVMMHGEAATVNVGEAEKLMKSLEKYVDSEKFESQQVLNNDETDLSLKKMPKKTYITKEEKDIPGNMLMKDWLTHLLCGNDSGECKPLLCLSPEEEGAKSSISSAEVEELCYVWDRTQAIAKKWHPNTAVVNRSINLFNDNVMAYFKNIQKSHEHQTTLEKFFSVEKRESVPKLSTSSAIRQKRKRMNMQFNHST